MNQALFSLVKAVLIVKSHFVHSCVDFYTWIHNQTQSVVREKISQLIVVTKLSQTRLHFYTLSGILYLLLKCVVHSYIILR